MRKMEKKPSADLFRNCIHWKLHQRDDDEPPLDTNEVEIEESKSLTDLDSTEGDLGGSDAGRRTKIWRAAAIDGDMKQRLLHKDEEDDEFDNFGSE